MKNTKNRREALKKLTIGTGLLATGCTSFSQNAEKNVAEMKTIKGNVNHSVCKWCYRDIPLEEFCEATKAMGIKSVELLGVEDLPTLNKYGLTIAIAYGGHQNLNKGFCNPDNHKELQTNMLASIPKVAEAGLDKIICFSGNANGIPRDVGMDNCARGLEPIVKEAEKYNVKIVMELLNSKVNHKDYMCDETEWGVALVDKIGSPQFKLLYDIYHMQIMEGDVIATIRKYKDYIAHYHTGGVPGRNEIDHTQELYYPAIMQAILDTGYTGFVAQEFIPKSGDPLKSLRESIEICDV